jgi:succinate dehydrogenase / fumarate reductase, cytochrome b subunit
MSTPAKSRPLSPFMIGPYYKPQLTSMLSITHRITGIALCAGALGLAWWMAAVASGPDAYVQFLAVARSGVGILVAIGLVFSLAFHTLNGIRHLLWDIGWGLDIPRAYATGWIVLVLSIVITAVLTWFSLLGGRP